MPLLPEEPSLHPPDLLSRPLPQDEDGTRWWVLHTRPRTEKALARTFHSHGMSYYLPLRHKKWRKSGRSFSSHVPLFPGYVFLLGDGQARLRALETNCVAKTLEVDDQAQLQEDLNRVQRLVTSGEPLTAEEKLQRGSPVEIVSGPFAGMRGVIIRRGGKLKFLVAVQFLQQGVSVEVESSMIRGLE